MRSEAHLAADAAPFDPAPGSDWMALRLALHPATRFAMFATPALWIWSANAAPEARLRCSASDGVLVTRRGGAVACHAIGPAEALLLEHIGSGASVGAAALAVAARFAGTDISRLFARIIVSGALAAPPPQ
jgi:sarcosine oxidase gamma subunit